MLREEFNERLDRLNEGYVTDLQMPYPTDEEYKIIEMVYSWYPDVYGRFDKDECVRLYHKFGMIIFYDMEKRAVRKLELTMRSI